jgi:bone morphogenetic protein 7
MDISRLLFFLLLSYVDYILAAFSGLYVDNGKGQTVMQRGISRREKLQFERDMLDLLGLPRKPRRTSNGTDLTSSAPKFLLDLYKSLDGSKMEDDFNLKKEDLRSIKESDSIMTFLSKSKVRFHLNVIRARVSE